MGLPSEFSMTTIDVGVVCFLIRQTTTYFSMCASEFSTTTIDVALVRFL